MLTSFHSLLPTFHDSIFWNSVPAFKQTLRKLPYCRREQAQDRGNQKVKAQGHEPSAPAEEGVLVGEDEEGDGGDSRNHAGEHPRHRDTLPIETQHHAWEELRHARVAQQKKRYERGGAVDGEVEANEAEHHDHCACQFGNLIVRHRRRKDADRNSWRTVWLRSK